ncbi:hypothetical protein ESO86_14830 [Agromyces binzhouensis]|uniref:Uncharacterized protein n=1 Tax=Agromyces binzhouensis TaxID=1817495 RepID=A0A4Q2J9S9_9MICO|nr:hypothetical protein ESO86_14830 [Agromyces binzhouensis]
MRVDVRCSDDGQLASPPRSRHPPGGRSSTRPGTSGRARAPARARRGADRPWRRRRRPPRGTGRLRRRRDPGRARARPGDGCRARPILARRDGRGARRLARPP